MTIKPVYGDRVRVQTTATGRYLCYGLALVSRADGTLFIDKVNHEWVEVHPTFPVPNDDALAGARAAIAYLKIWGVRDVLGPEDHGSL